MFCVYEEKSISHQTESHIRQFRESRNGHLAPMFRDNRAIIEIDANERYIVRNDSGEVYFIGQGYDEAIKRIGHAEPAASIEVMKDGKHYTGAQYKQDTAPTVFLVAYSVNSSNGVLFVGMDAKKGNQHLGSWQFIGNENEVSAEIREIVEEMGERDNTAIRYAWRDIEELADLKGANLNVGKLDFTAVRARARNLKARIINETTKSAEKETTKQAKKSKVKLKDGKFDVMSLYRIN